MQLYKSLGAGIYGQHSAPPLELHRNKQCSSGTTMKMLLMRILTFHPPWFNQCAPGAVQTGVLSSAVTHCSQTAAQKGRNCCPQIHCLQALCFKHPIWNKLISKNGAALGFSLRQGQVSVQGMSKITQELGGFTKNLQLSAVQAKIRQSPVLLQVSKSQQS